MTPLVVVIGIVIPSGIGMILAVRIVIVMVVMPSRIMDAHAQSRAVDVRVTASVDNGGDRQ